MTGLPEIVGRAAAAPETTALDLSLFGGVLRCGACRAEQPVGDIAESLRNGWPRCHGQTMAWVTLAGLAAERREVPDGYELAAVVSEDWRVEAGRSCRRGLGRHRYCGRPAVAAKNRGRMTHRGMVDAWWAYCLSHLYGNWIENGQVWHWILREKGNAGG